MGRLVCLLAAAAVICVGFPMPLHSATCTWTGPAVGYWDDGANWSTGAAPQAGDDVTINIWKDSSYNSMNVTITNTTPVFNSVTIGSGYVCTLTMTNWNTCLRANTITIGKRGTLTCATGKDQTETNAMSRVWVKCGDMTIVSGGKIDVSGKGFGLSTVSGSTGSGLGPGAGVGADAQTIMQSGAAHGGYGGAWRGIRPFPYDNPVEPVLPGSSGGRSKYGSAVSSGGGVVRIEATGTVTVNGSIIASAENSKYYNTTTTANDNTAGAGGSIFIDTSVFKGVNGVLRADGGSAVSPTAKNSSRVGGGGMIAVHYDTSLQENGFVSGMTISAAPGVYKSKTSLLPVVSNDLYRSEAGLGTLWFSDTKLLESLGTGISGRIESFSDMTFDTLVVTNGHVAFPKQGMRLSVLGDLVVSGNVARLEFGGDVATNRYDFVSLWAGTVPSRLSVGGNLRVLDGARLDVRSAESNETAGAVGAFVAVSGAMEVTGGGTVFAYSNPEKGGSPRFDVGSLFIGAGSRLTADERGFAGAFELYQGTTLGIGAFGPGRGRGESSSMTVSVSSAGGHGGFGGGRANNSGGKTYDDEFHPVLPGSGGSSSTSYSYHGGTGGGVIDVRASGAIVIEGSVTADGGTSAETSDKNGSGGGAGGTVFLYGDTVSSSAGSVISAKGGDAYANDSAHSYVGGGGGRIAIWAGASMYTDGVRASRITRASDPAAFMSPRISLLGTVSASGGNGTQVWSENWNPYGDDGTVWLTAIEPALGAVLYFR